MKTVKLSRRYVAGSATFDTITFREPKLADYRKLGKVIEVQKGVVITDSEALWSYAERLLEGSLNPGALGDLDLTDAVAVEEAIVDFFTSALSALRKRENSSSGSDGAQPTSTD